MFKNYKKPFDVRDTKFKKRDFVFTWNNYGPGSLPTLRKLFTDGKLKFLGVSEERAPTTGTPHLQGYGAVVNPLNARGLCKLLPTGITLDWMGGTEPQNRTYCSKPAEDGGPPNPTFEFHGTAPLTPKDKGEMERERWQGVWDAAVINDMDAIHPRERIRYYNTLNTVARDFQKNPEPLEHDGCHIWIYGPSRTGKSYAPRNYFGMDNIYLKNLTKWWCGYRDQDVVIINDMDPYHKHLAKNFKDWGDCEPFNGEIKGGGRVMRPRLVVVTANYTIDEVWEDVTTRATMHERFIEIYKSEKSQTIDFHELCKNLPPREVPEEDEPIEWSESEDEVIPSTPDQ